MHMQTTKTNIIVTFDDVIVENSYSLYLFLCNNFSFYIKYFNLTKLYTKKNIYERKTVDLFPSLYRTELLSSKLSSEQKTVYLTTAIMNIFNDFYNKDVFQYLPLTQLGKTILLNPLYYENSGIENIYILVKYHTKKEKEFKEQYLKKYITSSKFKIIFLSHNSKYETEIKKINKWSLLITDDIDTVEKIAGGNIDHKEFYLPRYGYDQASPELRELIKQKSATITYYNAIK